MSWVYLILGGLFEVGFASSLGKAQQSTGNEAVYWYGSFVICLCLSMLLLIKATQELPIGTGYAVWTGIGAIGTALVGTLYFKEPIDFWRIFFISTLVLSIVGLKYVSNT